MGACKTCQATGSRSLASPLLGADALAAPSATTWRGGKPSAARLGVRLLPASHVALATFARTFVDPPCGLAGALVVY